MSKTTRTRKIPMPLRYWRKSRNNGLGLYMLECVTTATEAFGFPGITPEKNNRLVPIRIQ